MQYMLYALARIADLTQRTQGSDSKPLIDVITVSVAIYDRQRQGHYILPL